MRKEAVLVQLLLPHVPPPALLADVVHVSPPVPREPGCVREALAAGRALEGLLACVEASVDGQLGVRAERLAAGWTLEAPVLCENPFAVRRTRHSVGEGRGGLANLALLLRSPVARLRPVADQVVPASGRRCEDCPLGICRR